MDEQLISKKELLERYGISYGALYRWKRKGLIPEEWFIKKATVTGQETFFPRELVCARVELIQNQKEELSLDDLAGLFGKEEKKREVLTIKSIYGDKTFYLDEIKELWLTVGNGAPRNVTHLIKTDDKREET